MKTLLVSAYYPNDMSFGAGQRTTLLHRALQQVGDVTTLILREGQPLGIKPTTSHGVVAEIGYPDQSFWRKYRRESKLEPLLRKVIDLDEFDVIVGRYLGPLFALPPYRGLSVVDADDAYYLYPSGDGIINRRGAALRTRVRAWVGQRAMRRVDHAWFCCERDREHFQLSDSSVLPNVVPTSTITVESVCISEPIVLMVGALWYKPNRDGIERFLTRSWPEIKRRVPSARFRAVGAAPVALRERWARHPGVECPGFVDDIAAEYQQARLTIVPVRSGGGTQIKALESLSHGRLPVVSPFVASGFAPHLRHDHSLLVAMSDADFIAHVCTVLDDPMIVEGLVLNGQDILKQVFSPIRFESIVRKTIEGFNRA